MLSDVFSHQNAQCVTALCDPLNAASWKLLERLGMRRKGHLIKTSGLAGMKTAARFGRMFMSTGYKKRNGSGKQREYETAGSMGAIGLSCSCFGLGFRRHKIFGW